MSKEEYSLRGSPKKYNASELYTKYSKQVDTPITKSSFYRKLKDSGNFHFTVSALKVMLRQSLSKYTDEDLRKLYKGYMHKADFNEKEFIAGCREYGVSMIVSGTQRPRKAKIDININKLWKPTSVSFKRTRMEYA